MSRKAVFLSIGVVIVALTAIGFFIDRARDQHQNSNEAPAVARNSTTSTDDQSIEANQTPDAKEWTSPLGIPAERVTKIKFGQYVSPSDSPIQPQRFTGYHTGWDFEILPGEETANVTVSAFCSGELVRKQTADGYGGVVVQKCKLNDEPVMVIYGHIALSSVAISIGDQVSTGQTIGSLGADRSSDTDGERKHLHFDIYKGSDVNIKGYTQSQSGLANWADPAIYLGALN